MYTPAQLARMFEDGALSEVAREVLRYGVILADAEDPETITRWRIVWHAGRVWDIEHRNGEVTGLGWTAAKLGRNEARAIDIYGLPLCLEAFKLYDSGEYGNSNIAFLLSRYGGEFTMRQADAMINAGRAVMAYAPK